MTNSKLCAVCGFSHRYSTSDSEHDYNATACVNTLRGKLEDAQAVIRTALNNLIPLTDIPAASESTLTCSCPRRHLPTCAIAAST